MRVAVVDIGTNSTRLLVADVRDGAVAGELQRESTVTRLGEGVDATGRLGDAPMQRVFDVLARYRAAIDEHGATHATAVLTSAVRDASNGAEFTTAVRDRYGLDARTIGGDEEATLTFAGATSERSHDGAQTVVVDIGGGSTEFVVGRDGEVSFHVSTQSGVVRQSERHLHDDPPKPEQLQALAAEVHAIVEGAVPADVRERTTTGIAVAGTATQCASIELALEPYDSSRVHGHVLELATCELLLARLAQMTNEQRCEVVGLHPARAPTIVAGIAMLIEVMRAFGLDRVEVSEHDILRGAALAIARDAIGDPRGGDARRLSTLDERPTQGFRAETRYSECRRRGPSFREGNRQPDIGPGQPFDRRLPPPGPHIRPSRYVPLPVLSGPTSGSRPFPWGRLPPLSVASPRPPQARFERRGYATDGSVSTLTSAGPSTASARSSAGRSCAGVRTSSPWPPSASTTRS